MVFLLAFSPLSYLSYRPRLIFLKYSFHHAQRLLEYLSPAAQPIGWHLGLPARLLNLPAVLCLLIFCLLTLIPSSADHHAEASFLLSSVPVYCPFFCDGLWPDLWPSKSYSSSFQVLVQLIRSFIFLAALTVLIIHYLLLWLFVYITGTAAFYPICDSWKIAFIDRNGFLVVL